MKSKIITSILACLAGLFVLLTLYSWKSSSNLNQNGWSISIGKKDILTSWKHHRGDTAYLNRKELNFNDSLFVSEFICGGTIKPPLISLHISKDDTITTQIELSDNMRGIPFVPLNKLLDYSNFQKLKVDVHSSFNHYYPGLDKDEPMVTLIIS